MTFPRSIRFARPFAVIAAGFFALILFHSNPLEARDVYKNFLDPAIPHHRAILDTLDRLKSDPKNAGLHNDLGCLIAHDGFWRDALREFDTAAGLDRKDGHPLFNAGLVYAWKGEWHAARREFAAARKRDPGNWPGWWMLGFAEEKLGNTEAAVDAYKVSLREDTGLFDVARNPFAADTLLRSRVLLETYSKRRLHAEMPYREQFEDPARVATFFQQSRGRVIVSSSSSPPLEESFVPTPNTGPVVTTVPATSPANAPPTRSAPPTTSRPFPPRPSPRSPVEAAEEGSRRVTESKPDDVPPVAAPNPAPKKVLVPGPGGNDD